MFINITKTPPKTITVKGKTYEIDTRASTVVKLLELDWTFPPLVMFEAFRLLLGEEAAEDFEGLPFDECAKVCQDLLIIVTGSKPPKSRFGNRLTGFFKRFKKGKNA